LRDFLKLPASKISSPFQTPERRKGPLLESQSTPRVEDHDAKPFESILAVKSEMGRLDANRKGKEGGRGGWKSSEQFCHEKREMWMTRPGSNQYEFCLQNQWKWKCWKKKKRPEIIGPRFLQRNKPWEALFPPQ